MYKVRRYADQQYYALKKVKMNKLSQKEQENSLNEVRILASVKSPYIIGYKQAFIENNSLWYLLRIYSIVMEFSDDGDLHQKILRCQKLQTHFNEASIWKTLIQILLGLRKLHEHNILHRDLKVYGLLMIECQCVLIN